MNAQKNNCSYINFYSHFSSTTCLLRTGFTSSQYYTALVNASRKAHTFCYIDVNDLTSWLLLIVVNTNLCKSWPRLLNLKSSLRSHITVQKAGIWLRAAVSGTLCSSRVLHTRRGRRRPAISRNPYFRFRNTRRGDTRKSRRRYSGAMPCKTRNT